MHTEKEVEQSTMKIYDVNSPKINNIHAITGPYNKCIDTGMYGEQPTMMLCEANRGLQPTEQFERPRRQKLSVILLVFTTYFKLFISSSRSF
jgi:hypothetical protein